MSALIELIERIRQSSKRDQRWLLKKLQPIAPQLATYLKDERSIPVTALDFPLPDWVADLSREPALLIASILNHGNYPWQTKFLNHYVNNKEQIIQHLNTPLPERSCQLLSQLWFQQLPSSFEQLLDTATQTEQTLANQDGYNGPDH